MFSELVLFNIYYRAYKIALAEKEREREREGKGRSKQKANLQALGERDNLKAIILVSTYISLAYVLHVKFNVWTQWMIR